MQPMTKHCDECDVEYNFFFMIEGCPVCYNESHIEELESQLKACEDELVEVDVTLSTTKEELRKAENHIDNQDTEIESLMEQLDEV